MLLRAGNNDDAVLVGMSYYVRTDTGLPPAGFVHDSYMLHVWLVDDLEYVADVHEPMHPCITSTGAIFDMNVPCHQSASGGTTAAGAATNERAAAAVGFCPIASLGKES